MPKPKRYRRLRGSSAYYPFGARTELRHRHRRNARLLQLMGLLIFCLAGALLLRQTYFHGGQPQPPARPATAETAVATPVPTRAPVTVEIRNATVDALAGTEAADAAAHASPSPQPTPEAETVETVLPQYQELYAQNPDLVGWLRLEGTDIDYPVVQVPEDNSYYLRRGFDRLYASGGTLFLDGRCRIGQDATANWLIYGHNMEDGSMFGTLTRYADEEFYRAHPTFTFDTLTRVGTWQVVAVVETTLGADELPYYSFFDAGSRGEWQRRVDAILDLALYDTGVVPKYGDQLLTLSTCGSPRADTPERFAVLAVRIPDTTEGGTEK